MKKLILIAWIIALLAVSAFAGPSMQTGYNYDPSAVAITGGTVSGTNITVGAAKTLDVSAGTLTLADDQIPVAKVNGAAASSDLATDNSTASHALYKGADGNIANQVLSIDAHAASTTITLIPGICPVIHNTLQADANIANTLPAVAEGLCFTALVTTTENDKTWRLTAAAVNTVCLGTTCGKDDIGFATTKVVKGAMFKCVAQGTEWFCNTITGEPDAGDL